MDQRQVLGAHHPQRAAHREELDQGAPLIRLGLQIGDCDAGQPCPSRQVGGGRVGGMQPHEGRGGAGDQVRGPVWAQEVPPRQAGAPLGEGERPHWSGVVVAAHGLADLRQPFGGRALAGVVLLLDRSALGRLRVEFGGPIAVP